jgi:hypothetical protein
VSAYFKRREFIALLGGAAAAWPLAARAQQPERTRRIGIILPAAADDAEFQTWVGAFLQALALLGWTIGRKCCDCRHQFMQKPESLGFHFGDEQVYPGGVSSRAIEARDEAEVDGVSANHKYDRNCRCCTFGRKCRRLAAYRNNDRHLTMDQVGGESREPIVLSVSPAILDRNVLALNVAGLLQTLKERADRSSNGGRRKAAEEPDHRHCRLLRTRREWPRCCSAA